MDYILAKISSKQLLKIKCPDDCGAFLCDQDVYQILKATREVFSRYCKFKGISILSKNPNISWCVKAGCDGYMRKDLQSSNKLVCKPCSQNMCFLCKNPWHGEEMGQEAYGKG